MMQPNKDRTHTGNLTIRTKAELQAPESAPDIQWFQSPAQSPGEHLMRNLTVAAAVMLCAVALRQGALPELQDATDAILTAVTNDDLLSDDSLGKLSFVSSLFPEATLVFSQKHDELLLPVSGGVVVHAWSQSEPYMAWRSASREVSSGLTGEVIGVYHGNGDERLVQVMGEQGIACLYGNLDEVYVAAGDAVTAGDVIGTVMKDRDCVLEVRRMGVSVDPALYLP